MESMIALSGLAGSDGLLYPLIGAGILSIVGFALIMKAGNKIGWILVAGAVVWAYTTLQPTMQEAKRKATPEQSSQGYFRDTKK